MDLLSIKSEAYNYEFVPADIEELIRWCQRQATFYEKFTDSNRLYQNEHAFAEIRQQIQLVLSLKNKAEELKALADHPEPNIEAQIAAVQALSDRLFNQVGLPPADSEIGLQLSAHIEIDPEVGYPALFALSSRYRSRSAFFK